MNLKRLEVPVGSVGPSGTSAFQMIAVKSFVVQGVAVKSFGPFKGLNRKLIG